MTGESPTIEDCTKAIMQMQNFLHGELAEADADEIRRHLMACEACLDYYDCETLISAMVRRCVESVRQHASEELRARIANLHVAV